jgi:CRISPR-associated protein Cas2
MYVVFAYDIPDDGRRLRVARTLRNALDRVQKSVFEGELGDDRLARLEERAAGLIVNREDSLRVYRLCGGCRRRVRVYGLGWILEDPDVFIV